MPLSMKHLPEAAGSPVCLQPGLTHMQLASGSERAKKIDEPRQCIVQARPVDSTPKASKTDKENFTSRLAEVALGVDELTQMRKPGMQKTCPHLYFPQCGIDDTDHVYDNESVASHVSSVSSTGLNHVGQYFMTGAGKRPEVDSKSEDEAFVVGTAAQVRVRDLTGYLKPNMSPVDETCLNEVFVIADDNDSDSEDASPTRYSRMVSPDTQSFHNEVAHDARSLTMTSADETHHIPLEDTDSGTSHGSSVVLVPHPNGSE